MPETSDRSSPLRSFGDILGALDALPLPVFAIRSDGIIRWLNAAAREVVGEKTGEHFSQVVAPESQGVVRQAFASKIAGPRVATDYEAVLTRKDGTPVKVEINSVPVSDDAGVIGVFGVAAIDNDRPQPRARPAERSLTPRQAEVLRYLAQGYTTEQMASAMGISKETVRNHVRGLLQALDAHSRLEAVTMAHVRGLV